MNEIMISDVATGPCRGDLPLAERERVSLLEKACLEIESAPYGTMPDVVAKWAAIINVSEKHLKKKYYDWRNGSRSWVDLANKSKLYKRAGKTGIRHPGFIAFFIALCGVSQRKTAPAIRRLWHIWDHRTETIPGYEGFPGWPNRPDGWSMKNLTVLANKHRLALQVMRQGTFAAQPMLAQVLTTRVGLQAGQVYVFDDNKIDIKVTCGKQVVDPLALVCMDRASGKVISWGMRPRLKRANPGKGEGRHMGLTGRDMRMFVVGILVAEGFNEETGCTFVAEHGTAAISPDFEEVLHRLYGDKVRISRSGMVGKDQVFYSGRGKGNFKHKADLESFFNLSSNEFSALALGASGHNHVEPEYLEGMRREELALLEKRESLMVTDPARAAALKPHFITFDYLAHELAWKVYGKMNSRTDHNLEGWEKMNFVTVKARLSVNSDHWEDLTTLDPVDAAYLMERSSRDPRNLQMVTKLSPSEAWERMLDRQPPMRKATQAEVIEMLWADCARPAKVRGAYISFKRQEMGGEVLRYPAVVVDERGREIYLQDGQKVYIMENFYHADSLFVADKDGRVIGKATLQQRVSREDKEKITKAWGKQKKHNADLLRPSKTYAEKINEGIEEKRRYNKAILSGEPLDIRGIIEAQEEEDERTLSPAQKAAITRRRNAADIDDMALITAEPSPSFKEEPDDDDYDDLSELY